MIDLSKVTAADFRPLLHQSFRMSVDGLELELELIEVREAKIGQLSPARAPFSLEFKSPPGRALPQAIYKITHRKLGAMDIFIVPVESTSSGVHYQAIFN
jgi:hypothetical protein